MCVPAPAFDSVLMIRTVLNCMDESSVRQVDVPPAARQLSTLSHIDYEDAFVVDVVATAERTPEQWARAALEDAPSSTRGALLAGWSSIGLKLDRTRSSRSVLGWRVRASFPDFVLLGA